MTSAQRGRPAIGPFLTMADFDEKSCVSNTTGSRSMRAAEFPAQRESTNYPIRESVPDGPFVAGLIDSEEVIG